MAWLQKFLGIFLITLSLSVHATRMYDVTTMHDIEKNQLIGYGLVIGLDQTGDQTLHMALTNHTLNNMLLKFGINNVFSKNMQLQNIASVIVTAKISTLSYIGEKIDVTVSSIGNASSLKGGILLTTPLKGSDNKIYAIAQGKIHVEQKNDNIIKLLQLNKISQFNNEIIHKGAVIEKKINTKKTIKNNVYFRINQNNFRLIKKMFYNINSRYPNIAKIINNKTIKLNLFNNKNQNIKIISDIKNMYITINKIHNTITLNKKNGLITINQLIKIHTGSILYHDISIIINKNKKYDTHHNKITLHLKNYDNLYQIINILNQSGIKPDDLMKILQYIKNIGFFSAKIQEQL